MFSFLTAPGFQPFSTAGLVLIGLAAVETVSMMFGHSLSGMVDAAFHLDHPEIDGGHDLGHELPHDLPHGAGSSEDSSLFNTIFDWLNAGRVPLLILLMAGLAAFTVVGFVIQIVMLHAAAPLPTWLAALIAFLCTIPVTRSTSRLVSQVMPRDESYALTEADLVGLVGVVTLGPVEADSAGRAKVKDKFGNWHFPRVRAARPELVIQQGTSVLMVDRVGSELTVVPAEGRLLEKNL